MEINMTDQEKDAERFQWLIRKGVAWRGCYDRDWRPGEWLYEQHAAREIIDDAMDERGKSLSAKEKNDRRDE